MRRLLPLVLLFLLCSATDALDPGKAKGTMQVGKETSTLTHAYAHLHDNTEGLLKRPMEMRILIIDREVKPAALNGLTSLPVMDMARQGKVRGLLLTFDPHDHTNVTVTFLYQPGHPAAGLHTQSRLHSRGFMNNLHITAQRVVGEIADKAGAQFSDLPTITYATSFSAPLFHEPKVTQDLQGQAAKDSVQVQVLRAVADAMDKVDFAALRALATARFNHEVDTLRALGGAQVAEVATYVRETAAEMAQAIAEVQRLVVRGNHAVVLFSDKSSRELERVGNEWKSDR